MMPRTKLGDAFAQKPPPIDWLWAAVLERMKVKKVNLKDLAKVAGCSYESMRRYINITPWNWPYTIRNSVCKELGLEIALTPSGFDLRGEAWKA